MRPTNLFRQPVAVAAKKGRGRSDGKKRIAEKKKRRRAKRYDHVPILHYKVKNPIFYDTDNLKTQTIKLKNYI